MPVERGSIMTTPQSESIYSVKITDSKRQGLPQYLEDLKEMLPSYLQTNHGLKGIKKPFKCLNPDHTDNNPSMSIVKGSAGKKVHCFACNATYDIYDIIGQDYSLISFKEQAMKACELYGIEYKTSNKEASTYKPLLPAHEVQDNTAEEEKDLTEYFKECNERLMNETDNNCMAYLASRGISRSTAKQFNLGYDPKYETTFIKKDNTAKEGKMQCLIIPTGKYSATCRNISAGPSDKYNRYRDIGSKNIFNAEAIKSDKPVFIVEGEIDALSIIEAGGSAIALRGTAEESLKKELKECRSTQVFIVATDADEAGMKARNKIINMLHSMNIKCETVLDGFYTGKDANETLQEDKQAFSSKIEEIYSGIQKNTQKEEEDRRLIAEETLKNYKKEICAKDNLASFLNGIKESVNAPVIETGYKQLDLVLDGGLYDGLYILGAVTSLGKTTYALQMADNIAFTGKDVIIFSLEMARSELISKSISRLTMIESKRAGEILRLAKTNRQICDGKRYQFYKDPEMKVIDKAEDTYSKIAEHVYIHEGVGNIGTEQIRQAIGNHIAITGNKPVVFIDYLQIVSPADIKASDKQNMDKNILEMKRISRDYKIPVICVSSLNRDNYRKDMGVEALKESGSIEYSADCIMGLQLQGTGTSGFDYDIAKSESPRRMELKIMKQRNGISGRTIAYKYYPAFNCFEEDYQIK